MSYKDKDPMFIFDDELCVEDTDYECIDGYLWALDVLVERVKDNAKKSLLEEELESMDNINFYAYRNLKTGCIDLISTFWYFKGDKELHFETQLQLSNSEAKELTSSMEAYCRKRYGESCLGFLNEARTHYGLPALAEPDKHLYFNNSLSQKTINTIDKQLDTMLGTVNNSKTHSSLDEKIGRASAIASTLQTEHKNSPEIPER